MVLSNAERQRRFRESLKERVAEFEAHLRAEIEESRAILAQIAAGARFSTAEGSERWRDNTDELRALQERRIERLERQLAGES